MHQFVYLIDRICDLADARVAAVSAAVLYGRGIFTTIAINDSKPFLWEKHWARLQANAAQIRLDISDFTEGGVRDALADLIERNGVLSGLARITFLDESDGGPGLGTSILITNRPRRELPGNFKLTVSPYRVNSASPLAGVKSCNYLENLLAIEEARSRGFDEAVRLNERGEIAGACMANIFWRKDGRLYTPALASGCLAGTTRELFIEKKGATESIAVLEELKAADAVMLTSAGLGIVEVSGFEGRKFGI